MLLTTTTSLCWTTLLSCPSTADTKLTWTTHTPATCFERNNNFVPRNLSLSLTSLSPPGHGTVCVGNGKEWECESRQLQGGRLNYRNVQYAPRNTILFFPHTGPSTQQRQKPGQQQARVAAVRCVFDVHSAAVCWSLRWTRDRCVKAAHTLSTEADTFEPRQICPLCFRLQLRQEGVCAEQNDSSSSGERCGTRGAGRAL